MQLFDAHVGLGKGGCVEKHTLGGETASWKVETVLSLGRTASALEAKCVALVGVFG